MADFSLSLESELRVSVAAFVLGLAAAIGCQRSQPAGTSEVRPTYNRDTGRLERISYDRNRDTRMDAWLVMLGTSVRVGVDLAYYKRNSPIALRDYDGLRVGGSFTYGLTRQ